MPYNTTNQSMGQIELFNHLLYLKPFNCVQMNKPETHLEIKFDMKYEILI